MRRTSAHSCTTIEPWTDNECCALNCGWVGWLVGQQGSGQYCVHYAVVAGSLGKLHGLQVTPCVQNMKLWPTLPLGTWVGCGQWCVYVCTDCVTSERRCTWTTARRNGHGSSFGEVVPPPPPAADTVSRHEPCDADKLESTLPDSQLHLALLSVEFVL